MVSKIASSLEPIQTEANVDAESEQAQLDLAEWINQANTKHRYPDSDDDYSENEFDCY